MASAKAEVEDGTVQVDRARAEDVRQKLIQIRRGTAEAKFDEGELLAEVLDGSYWDTYGFQSFDHYCSEELGYQERTGYKRAAIWRTFAHELNYERHHLAEFQWSKLELIEPVAKTKAQAEAWLKDASKLSWAQLKFKVEEHRAAEKGDSGGGGGSGKGGKSRSKTTRVDADGVGDDEGNEPKVTFRCVMFQSQYDNLKAAIEMASGQLSDKQGPAKTAYALDMIAADFQATGLASDNDGGSFKRLQHICEDLGRSFNAKLSVTMNEGAVAEQFRKDRESSKERKKKLRGQKKAQAGDTEDPETGEKIDPETGEPKKPKAKKRSKK